MPMSTLSVTLNNCSMTQHRSSGGIMCLYLSNMNNYVVNSKLGRGKYSHVLEGTDKVSNKAVAIKVLLPIRKDKIRREYHFLKQLDHPNIIQFKDIVKCDHLKTTSIIMEHFPHQDFREIYHSFSISEIKHYMRQLFRVLSSINLGP